MSNFCAIDFGTSNSTIGILKNNKPKLLELEGKSLTTPSAIFYEDEENITSFGRNALKHYQDDYSGRLLRSFKSILGTSLMNDNTIIRNSRVSFESIIKDYLNYLKNSAENIEQATFESVVIGRPINFVDDNEIKNKQAQQKLYEIAKSCGFKNIEFQFEPIAASLKYEQSLQNEELVLIIDIGGGTTDISVVNLSPEFINMADRSKHCLANYGVHIGGTDFDKHLSLNTTMKLLGYQQNIDSNLKMPKHLYHDMATWHRINNIYTPEFKRAISRYQHKLDNKYFSRLMNVIENKLASSIALMIEQNKIELSSKQSTIQDLYFIEKGLNLEIFDIDLHKAIKTDLLRINKAIEECLNQANITKDKINSIFLTGGSSKMALIKNSIKEMFPATKIDNSDSLSSVGFGLVLDASRKF